MRFGYYENILYNKNLNFSISPMLTAQKGPELMRFLTGIVENDNHSQVNFLN